MEGNRYGLTKFIELGGKKEEVFRVKLNKSQLLCIEAAKLNPFKSQNIQRDNVSPTHLKNLQIFIESKKLEDSNELDFHVCGIKLSVENEIDSYDIKFALKETPWEQWLGMEITLETIQNFSATNIVAHCLYEMTWNHWE